MKRQMKIAIQASGCVLVFLLASCAQKASQTSSTEKPGPTKTAQPLASGATELTATEVSNKSPHQLAQYIFQHNGCNDCHTLGEQGKFGYTARGQQIHQKAEGCIDLLTAMNVIALTPQSQWTAEDRAKAGHFQEYGCTSCHQITPGKMGLTAMGAKLAVLHMSCPAVEHLLNERKQ